MKRSIRPILFAALAFGASTVSLLAQTPSPGPQGPPDGPPPHHGPPPSPLFDALDTNHDGVLSAEEIANAPAALAKLAGTSGQITRESLRPQRRDDDHPQPGDRQGGPPPGERGHHGPPPPPDAQASPAASPDAQASPSPALRHAPEDRRHRPQEDAASSPGASPAGSPPVGPDGRHHGPPHGNPLFDALDTNHDGVLSADEIANAPAALKALDKNGDGQITRDELRPPGPPPGPRD